MEVVWTAEAMDDLDAITDYYLREAGPRTAGAVQERIIADIQALQTFPDRIRASSRIPGTRELVIRRLPYIAFVRATQDGIQVLNIVHTARRFP